MRTLLVLLAMCCLPVAAQVIQGGTVLQGGAVISAHTPAQQLTMSPAGGTFSSAQVVTVSTTLPSATLFCTTDGTPASPAGTQVGSVGAGTGTITMSASATLNCMAVQGAKASQNLQASQSGWKVNISSCASGACTRGTPTATAADGVSGLPTSWAFAWGTSGGLTETMTGPTFTQILAPFTTTATSDSSTGIAQHKVFSTTSGSSVLQNNELDSESIDATHTINGVSINHNFGFQCEQGSDTGCPGQWAIAGGNASGADQFFCTGVTLGCPIPTTGTTSVYTQAHWTVGDATGPAGLGLMHYDYITINGTVFPMTNVALCSSCGFPNGTLSNEPSSFISFYGSQDQLDIGSTAGTVNRTDVLANVTQFTYNPAPVTASASYVIQ